MIRAGSYLRARHAALWGVALIAVACAAPLAGCKNNSSSAATVEHRAGKPPVVVAQFAPDSLLDAGPLSSPAWQNAAWSPLIAPANTSRTTAPTKAAVLFDAATLYVAVISALPTAPDPAGPDAVSLFLDTKGDGRELLQVSADSAGTTRCAWIRSNVAIEPLDDGSPNLGYPLDVRPAYQLAGLNAQIRTGVFEGQPVWTLTLAVPVAGMPALMQVPPANDAHWKFNILRTYLADGAGQRAVMQSNLSPVYINAQTVSPYRMADLVFAP